jgi:hypothetical protein
MHPFKYRSYTLSNFIQSRVVGDLSLSSMDVINDLRINSNTVTPDVSTPPGIKHQYHMYVTKSKYQDSITNDEILLYCVLATEGMATSRRVS